MEEAGKRECFRRFINAPFLDLDAGYLICATCENMSDVYKMHL